MVDEVEKVFNYINAMKRNALSRLKEGKKPGIIILYANDCGACHSQFKYFARKNKNGEHGLDVPIEMVEMPDEKIDDLVKSKQITAKSAWNKRNIIDNIIPVCKSSDLGKKIVEEAREWAKETKNPDNRIDGTPAWLHFNTHELVGFGFRTGKNLLIVTDPKRNTKREARFNNTFSSMLGKSCSVVACDLNRHVKIDDAMYRKEG